MPRRGDNIRKRKDGRWEARYSLVDPHSQATKYGSVYGHTYQEAKEKRDRIIKEGPRQSSVAGPSFSDVLLSWQSANQVRLKESSINTAGQNQRCLEPIYSLTVLCSTSNRSCVYA